MIDSFTQMLRPIIGVWDLFFFFFFFFFFSLFFFLGGGEGGGAHTYFACFCLNHKSMPESQPALNAQWGGGGGGNLCTLLLPHAPDIV